MQSAIAEVGGAALKNTGVSSTFNDSLIGVNTYVVSNAGGSFFSGSISPSRGMDRSSKIYPYVIFCNTDDFAGSVNFQFTYFYAGIASVPLNSVFSVLAPVSGQFIPTMTMAYNAAGLPGSNSVHPTYGFTFERLASTYPSDILLISSGIIYQRSLPGSAQFV